jgi:hypothetical protein
MSNRAIRRAAERQSQKLASAASKVASASAGGPDRPPMNIDFAEPLPSEQTPSDAVQAHGTTCTNAVQAHGTTCTNAVQAHGTTCTNAMQAHGTTCTSGKDTMFAEQTPTGRPETVSEARLNANRANAQFSSGPKTQAGKAKSSMNAVKTGLTSRSVLLPLDDALIYQQHLDRNFADFSPLTDKEKALVQTIADTEWRLLRIAPLEAGIYAVGRRKLADQFADEPDFTNRQDLITAEVFLTYRKDFSNLALQERRLRNQRKADIAELQQLQQERLEKATQKTKEPARGFDFSLLEFQTYNERNRAQYPVTNADLDFKTFLAAYRTEQKESQAA